jgi:hypothetical protein
VGRGACAEDAGWRPQCVCGYLWLRTPHSARATAVRVQWLGDVPIFAAFGQLVMHMHMLLNVRLGGGSRRVRWMHALAFRGSAVSLQISLRARAEVGTARVSELGGMCACGQCGEGSRCARSAMQGCVLEEDRDCGEVVPVRSLRDLVCFLTGTGGGLWGRARRRCHSGQGAYACGAVMPNHMNALSLFHAAVGSRQDSKRKDIICVAAGVPAALSPCAMCGRV